MIDFNILMPIIEELKKALIKNDEQEIKSLIKDIVKDYNSSNN
jgi:hypothetical protein